jgi:hypothetical protein
MDTELARRDLAEQRRTRITTATWTTSARWTTT